MTVYMIFLPGPPANRCMGNEKGNRFLPYKGNCKKFYHCNGKNLAISDCPGKLVFNPARNKCDFMKHLSKTSVRFCRG